MSGAEFTPGPWKVSEDGGGLWYGDDGKEWIEVLEVQTESDGFCIAQVNGVYYETVKDGTIWGPSTDAEVEANARLIKAAPDMYEALEDLLSNVSPTPASMLAGPEIKAQSQSFAKARAVLAKVRGEGGDT